MVNKRDRDLFVVFNAGCKDADLAHAQQHLKGVEIDYLDSHALLALQGPAAVAVLARLNSVVQAMSFGMGATLALGKYEAFVTRSGYTGEDGFEISVPGDQAEDFARWLLSQPEVKPIGLGARDSLRLEAGLCLYGHELDPTTTPIEAGLNWTISKRRREDGGFLVRRLCRSSWRTAQRASWSASSRKAARRPAKARRSSTTRAKRLA